MSSVSALSSNEDSSHMEETPTVHHAFFSRDRELITLCTSVGVSIFNASNFGCVCNIPVVSGVQIADVAPGSSLMAIVIRATAFSLWNAISRERISAEVVLDNDILNLKLTGKRVLVLTASKLLVFRLHSLELIEAIDRGEGIVPVSLPLLECTPEGLCAFTIADNGVQMINAVTLQRMQPIRSHTSPVSALELNEKHLITGSSRGTILRVFSVPSMELVALLRRGRHETAIRSIVTSPDFLTVTGDSDTVHLFRQVCTGTPAASPSLMSSMLSMFPKQYKDALEAQRDFAFIRLRRETTAFNFRAAVVRRNVVVVSEDTGFAFVYELNPTKGGECRLKSEHALLSGVAAFSPSKIQAVEPDDSPGETTTPADFFADRSPDFATVAAVSSPRREQAPSIVTDDASLGADPKSVASEAIEELTAAVSSEQSSFAEQSRGSSMEGEEWTEEKKKKKKKKKKAAELPEEFSD